MMNNTIICNPFIHLFKSQYHCYIYDVNTNSIVKISDNCYNYLYNLSNEFSNIEMKNTDELQKELNQLMENGYLGSKRIKRISADYIDSLDYILDHRLGMLTLQVTCQCNFRCSYCHFTYGGDILNRSHSNEIMSWDTAKAAIDFYAKRTRDRRNVNIGFYGGEPLLEYDLIKQCIEYANKLFRGKNITYSMTTNGALLDADKLIYLIDNKTSIMVSLDGPKEIHDKNRKMASNGSGSFEFVYANLKNIQDNYPEYYKKLTYNSVVDTSLDCSVVGNYFDCSYSGNRDVKVSILEPSYGNTRVFNEEFQIYYNNEIFKGILVLAGILKPDATTIFENMVIDEIEKYKITGMKFLTELPDEAIHGGPCKPGITKVFVNIKGEIFPCEKVSESIAEMKVGNIYDGYDINKVCNIINYGNVTEEYCKNCWCFAHCTSCVHTSNDGRNISKKFILSRCQSIREDIEKKLKVIVAIDEGKSIMRKML